jgi:predicted DNA-binding transcriptional regulator AlpA
LSNYSDDVGYSQQLNIFAIFRIQSQGKSHFFAWLVTQPEVVPTWGNRGLQMGVVNNEIESLVNERDVARVTGLSVSSVRRWRHLRKGPKYLKIGTAVRYKKRGSLGVARVPSVWR